MVQSVKNYLSNTKIAQKYNVSNPTVGEWIRNAVENKNNIKVELVKSKYRILDTEHNDAELTRLSQHAKRYKGSDNRKVVKVSKEFYEIFSEEQIIEIINSLQSYKILPVKYTFVDEGAIFWDKFITEQNKNKNYKTLSLCETLLQQTRTYINYRTENKKINIIDIGQGNCYPIKETIEYFIKENKLNSYIAIDISQKMLEIAEKNIKTWFPELEVKTYCMDVEKDSISKVCFENKTENVSNVICYLGGNVGNLEEKIPVYYNFKQSISENDFIIIDNVLDNIKDNTNFSYMNRLSYRWKQDIFIPKILGIDVDNAEVEYEYNKDNNSRSEYLVLDKDYELHFEVLGKKIKLELFKGDKICVWRHHRSIYKKEINVLDSMSLYSSYSIIDKTHSWVSWVCENNKI
jgi:uncharacterized SAM-dependent methyltransferase